jgi:hypothetical protein
MKKLFFRSFFIFLLIYASLTDLLAQVDIYQNNFDSIDGWKIVAADEVDIKISKIESEYGTSLRLDYHFIAGSGYGGIQKVIPLELPNNYEFSFKLKGDSPNNDLEFKLLDEEGTSVWWMNRRNYSFPKDWQTLKIKKRQIEKAWGPSNEYSPKKIHKIEFMIASVNGGKGTLYIDDFKLVKREVPSNLNIQPEFYATSQKDFNHIIALAFDSNKSTFWHSDPNSNKDEIIIDFKKEKELGGLTLNWDENNYPLQSEYFISDDKINWTKIYSVKNGKGNLSFIYLPETETRYLKIELNKSNKNGFALTELTFEPLSFGSNLNRFFETVSSHYPRGFYPKYFTPEKSYFTITGVNNDTKEALINEEGQVEIDKSSFSIEPFIHNGKELITWENSINIQSLEDEYLPIPIVKRSNDNLELEIKMFADGEAGKSILNLQYTLKNKSSENQNGNIYFAIRPFQVNPSYQFLNTSGGVAKVESIFFENDNAIINNNKAVYPLLKPDNKGASVFDRGEIINFISKNKLPGEVSVEDNLGLASSAYMYNYNLQSGEEIKYYFLIPFHEQEISIVNPFSKKEADVFMENKLASIKNFWKEKLNSFEIKLQGEYKKWTNTLRSTLAYILINRDNAGIQPGSRSYERSWIRDGSLTSSALLKLGITEEVKDFIEWYSSYQYKSGKVPCVVDRRGPDPVPENDSHGQLIYLIHQYFLFTNDTTFLRSKFQNVKAAVDYIAELISQRSTDDYKLIDSLKNFYGILPESISHEGYSEKPMHSYWDNFFAIKGLKDAVDIASILGEKESELKFISIRDKFKTDLYNSLSGAIKTKEINYIPGCVELGDFDATSTSIALYPCNEKLNLPQPYLNNTFNKYYDYFVKRRDDTTFNWINYTPYELRTVGAFIQLDLPERGHALLNYFFKDQRPQGWNHWAEVVWKDPKLPRFIGDMPHTWVGSDFVSSLRSFFVYEDEQRQALIIGAGIIPDWIEHPLGISIKNMKTYYGTISFTMNKSSANTISILLEGSIKMPTGGMVIKNIYKDKSIISVRINDVVVKNHNEFEMVVNQLPATVEINY